MKRRDFLNISLPAAGAIFLTPGVFNNQAMAEINRQFSAKNDFDEYDLVVNGAGLSGYFAAVYAARKGKKVLIVEKRTSPGYDIAAKSKLWLGAEGVDELRPELLSLFLPEGESRERKRIPGTGPESSRYGDELLLFSGSLRKSLLRNLLVNKVHVLLMTDICGLISDNENVQGVLLANKHGLYTVKCRNFIDASDHVLFSRGVLGNNYEITKAGFVLELAGAVEPEKKEVEVSQKYGLRGNKLFFHQGKLSDDQLFIEFEFMPDSQKPEAIEHQARSISAALGKDLPMLDRSLKQAQINQFALETSIFLNEGTLPDSALKGHYLLAAPLAAPNCRNVLEMEASAEELVDELEYNSTRGRPQALTMVGSTLNYTDLALTEVKEPGLAVPLKRVRFDFAGIAGRDQCQVLVAGGGTGGAMAAIGAAEKGANTIAVDYFNDLGGTKTIGGVMGYYHGVKDNSFFKKQSEEAERTAFEAHMNKNCGRRLYHLNGVLGLDGRFLTGSIICDTLVDSKRVKGIVVCRQGKLEAIESQVTIDATGDGDVAAFAGAEYQIGNSRTGETQNYSQWDISGKGGAASPPNRDYDIIDNTKISELQRGLFLSHYEAHFYDFCPMLTVRESRRIAGEYTLNLLDAVEGAHFEDVISLASSDFDPHNIGSSEFSKCGFLLPHSNDIVLEIPYRCIVPKTLDGLLISGKAISQTHNAMQFTRMTADIIVLGYLTGQLAADQAWNNIQPRNYDISGMQREWAAMGYLPPDYNRETTWKSWEKAEEIRRRVSRLAAGAPEYLYECSKLPREKTVPVLLEYFGNPADHDKLAGEGRLLLAKALAWFGNPEGARLIGAELKDLFAREQAEGYPDGYVDDYDFIRGREKNVLEGLFWRINQNIALLAMSGDRRTDPEINHIIQNTVSGGGMVERTSDYFNHRIDLRIIPFYNRILNCCFYAERLPNQLFIPALEKLLNDENIGGFRTTKYSEVRWRIYGGLLETAIATALARCGAGSGYQLLASYLDDVHYNLKSFAAAELEELTGEKHGYNSVAWAKYTAALSYPQPVKQLTKAVEV